MRLDFRQLQALVAIAETGNYQEASQQLHITQPALTKQIQSLEKILGCTLLYRGRHGAELTAMGQQLLPQAKILVEQGDRFQAKAKSLILGVSGQLSIGFGLSTFELAPALVAKFRQHTSDVMVHLQDLPSSVQHEMLLADQIQLGFIRDPHDDTLSTKKVLSDRLALVTPASSEGNFDKSQDELNTILYERPFLQMSSRRAGGLNNQIARYLGVNRPERAMQEAEDIHTLVALVSAGIGNAILPESVRFLAGSAVNIHPLDGDKSSWDICLAWNSSVANPIRDRFLETTVGLGDKPL
ncbi:LysR family transcriptional regulator [Dongshaea marina]|uniref:LysR family transcriptional regulator n=1 Tax=Dongshaea marina TaxID=2047966 RepID=UPI000D3E705C|nr:LysR family transcriptional regulator [Dongshaea marina]